MSYTVRSWKNEFRVKLGNVCNGILKTLSLRTKRPSLKNAMFSPEDLTPAQQAALVNFQKKAKLMARQELEEMAAQCYGSVLMLNDQNKVISRQLSQIRSPNFVDKANSSYNDKANQPITNSK
jgi:hypothetical protein